MPGDLIYTRMPRKQTELWGHTAGLSGIHFSIYSTRMFSVLWGIKSTPGHIKSKQQTFTLMSVSLKHPLAAISVLKKKSEIGHSCIF